MNQHKAHARTQAIVGSSILIAATPGLALSFAVMLTNLRIQNIAAVLLFAIIVVGSILLIRVDPTVREAGLINWKAAHSNGLFKATYTVGVALLAGGGGMMSYLLSWAINDTMGPDLVLWGPLIAASTLALGFVLTLFASNARQQRETETNNFGGDRNSERQ